MSQFELSSSEYSRLSEAFKSAEFRDLFADYARELQNPNTKQEYEQYLTQLEADQRRTGDSFSAPKRLLKPVPDHCVKVTPLGDGGPTKKLFINFCSTDLLGPHSLQGNELKLPHSVSKPREFESGAWVADFVCSSAALRAAEYDQRIAKAIQDVATEAIAKQSKDFAFAASAQKRIIRLKTIKCKGGQPPMMTLMDDKTRTQENSSQTKQKEIKDAKQSKSQQPQLQPMVKPVESSVSDSVPSSLLIVPSYSLIERFDGGLAANADPLSSPSSPGLSASSVPSHLVVRFSLPLCSSISCLDVSLSADRISLVSQPLDEQGRKYSIGVRMPYTVDPDNSKAKFVSKSRTLNIECKVKTETSKTEIPQKQQNNEQNSQEQQNEHTAEIESPPNADRGMITPASDSSASSSPPLIVSTASPSLSASSTLPSADEELDISLIGDIDDSKSTRSPPISILKRNSNSANRRADRHVHWQDSESDSEGSPAPDEPIKLSKKARKKQRKFEKKQENKANRIKEKENKTKHNAQAEAEGRGKTEAELDESGESKLPNSLVQIVSEGDCDHVNSPEAGNAIGAQEPALPPFDYSTVPSSPVLSYVVLNSLFPRLRCSSSVSASSPRLALSPLVAPNLRHMAE